MIKVQTYKDIAALVVDKSVPPPPASSSTLHPDQQHHTGLPASLLQEALPPHASESQNYYSSQLSSATFKHASSTSYSRSDYPDYEASPNAGLGPSASYAGAVGQQSTSYPASSYSQKMSSFPNYYNWTFSFLTAHIKRKLSTKCVEFRSAAVSLSCFSYLALRVRSRA